MVTPKLCNDGICEYHFNFRGVQLLTIPKSISVNGQTCEKLHENSEIPDENISFYICGEVSSSFDGDGSPAYGNVNGYVLSLYSGGNGLLRFYRPEHQNNFDNKYDVTIGKNWQISIGPDKISEASETTYVNTGP